MNSIVKFAKACHLLATESKCKREGRSCNDALIMSARIPPNLLYLTVFNPTLIPSNTAAADDDDEDAEEQAHIIFYTSRERAVSRDRMLRQIGLAKALINFSECVSCVGSTVVFTQA